MAARLRAVLAENGCGLWAVEVPGVAPFIGFIGLAPAAVRGALHAGGRGRLAARPAHWGRGYAPEGARAALEYGFGDSDSTRSSR